MLLISKMFQQKSPLRNAKNLEKINISILWPVLILGVLSCTMLFSAASGNPNIWAWRQAFVFCLGILTIFFVATLNHQFLKHISYFITMIAIGGLITTHLFGITAMGAKRWISIMSFRIQPSEMTKVAIVLFLAKFFNHEGQDRTKLGWHLFTPTVIVSCIFALIAIQPDLATAGIVLLMTGMILFGIGLDRRIFLTGLAAMIIGMPIIWQRLHQYQKLRIINFFNPEHDQLGSGYNIIQSKIAIGSGGIFGKGLLRGSQSQLNFLPEHQTDFMFTMLAEELGFMGCAIAMMAYGFIIYRGLEVSLKSKSIFNKIIALGGSMFFFVQCSINAAMTVGLFPVAGVPMPMLSYGGSAIITSSIFIGLIIHADLNQNQIR